MGHLFLFGAKGVGDDGFALEVVGGVEGFVAGGFARGDAGVKLAGGDLFGRGMDVAELAGGQVAFFGAHGRAKGAAEDGARFVQIAGAVIRIEDGAGFVIRKLFEKDGLVVVFRENAGSDVAGEPRVETLDGGGNAFSDAKGAGRIGFVKEFETGAEACGILVGDGEDSDSALRAAGSADQVRAAAEGSVGECCIDDLDEIARRHGSNS